MLSLPRNLVMWLLYQNLQLCVEGYNYTLNHVYKRFVWSFKALWHREEPTEDWNGKKAYSWSCTWGEADEWPVDGCVGHNLRPGPCLQMLWYAQLKLE